MSKIFISWSKARSKSVAEAFRQLIDATMWPSPVETDRGASPKGGLAYLSEDLPKGGNWFNDLADQLENASVGIICITPENRSSPWLLFEAGALLRCGGNVQLFPVLLDVEPQSLEPPLSLLQATVLSRDATELTREITGLLQVIANDLTARLREAQGSRTTDKGKTGKSTSSPPGRPKIKFEANGDPDRKDRGPKESQSPMVSFCEAIAQIEPVSIETIMPEFQGLFDRKTFREPFQDCTDQRWLDRYAAARLAQARLTAHTKAVASALPEAALSSYAKLQSAVDSFAMTMSGQLLQEQRFKRDPAGNLKDVESRLLICERRRQTIEDQFLRLIDPLPPVFPDARVYEDLQDLKERKIKLLHPLEARLKAKKKAGSLEKEGYQGWELEQAKTSGWLYDRLVYYINARVDKETVTVADLLEAAERECEIIETADQPVTLVGLYYVLETIKQRSGKSDPDAVNIAPLAARINAVIERWRRPFDAAKRADEGPDANRKLRSLLEKLTAKA